MELDLVALREQCKDAAKNDGLDHGEQAPLYAYEVLALLDRLERAETRAMFADGREQMDSQIRTAAIEECIEAVEKLSGTQPQRHKIGAQRMYNKSLTALRELKAKP